VSAPTPLRKIHPGRTSASVIKGPSAPAGRGRRRRTGCSPPVAGPAVSRCIRYAETLRTCLLLPVRFLRTVQSIFPAARLRSRLVNTRSLPPSCGPGFPIHTLLFPRLPGDTHKSAVSCCFSSLHTPETRQLQDNRNVFVRVEGGICSFRVLKRLSPCLSGFRRYVPDPGASHHENSDKSIRPVEGSPVSPLMVRHTLPARKRRCPPLERIWAFHTYKCGAYLAAFRAGRNPLAGGLVL